MKFYHLISFKHILYSTVDYDVVLVKGALTVDRTALRYDITVAVSFLSFKIKFI